LKIVNRIVITKRVYTHWQDIAVESVVSLRQGMKTFANDL